MAATHVAANEAIEAHQAAGRRFEAGGAVSFVREHGSGAPVVLLHGVPTSSFLYRKVIPALAQQGLRGIAFDFPGLGLAARPESFDYTWSGLARWTSAALDSLEIERCHLVVHDIGGPIGCLWAVANPDRVLSLTALNTLLGLASFRRPWTMAPFAVPGVGRAWLSTLSPRIFERLFYLQGVAKRSAVPRAEVRAHYELLKREDGGRAFLRIMRGFELGDDRQRSLWAGLAGRPYPARIVWGEHDPAIGADQMRAAEEALGVEDPILLDAKHFLQEDQPIAVAQAVADLAAPLG
jgi:pimeloyl-ACP methyl ester carboxylesterase